MPVTATGAASLRRVDDVVGRDGVEGDARHRRHRVDRVSLASVAVVALPAASVVVTLASTVRSPSASQLAARHVDAERQARLHLAGVVDAVDRHGHRVADLHVAAHRAGDRNAAAQPSATLTTLSAVMASRVMLATGASVSSPD